MLQTYKTFKQIQTKNYSKFSNEELALLYQENADDNLIIEVFCRNFGYWKKISDRFRILDNEDKVSIILEKITAAMNTFNISMNNCFLAYTYKIIYNAFGHYKILNNFKGRAEKLNDTSLDKVIDEDLVLQDCLGACDEGLDKIVLQLSLNKDLSLNKTEKDFCNLILDYPTISNAELTKKLNISNSYLYVIIKNLKIKIRKCL